MVTMKYLAKEGRLSGHVAALSKSLFSQHRFGDTFVVSLPILYSSNNHASVEIAGTGDYVTVTDIGNGHLESTYGGAEKHFDKAANEIASRQGLGYDGHQIFDPKVPIEQLQSAVTLVANASVQAASLALQSATKDAERSMNAEVFEKLQHIFGTRKVAKSVDIAGGRETWAAHNVVQIDKDRKAIFEFVGAHQNSVSSKFLMFSDLLRGEELVDLNCVVTDLQKFNAAKGAVLGDIADVLTFDAGRSQYIEAAKAA